MTIPSRKRLLEMEAERILTKLAKLEARPDDNFEDGEVIWFEKQFTPGGTSYTYAAVKAAGRWYTTGPKSPKAYTWDDLLDWMETGVPVKAIYWASKYEKIDLPKVEN